jgi:DNA-binding response OmpR family regulator
VTKKRILCVEDHPEMIELVQLILGRRGYEVVGAVGGREGIEAMLEEPPDLLLLDLMMPDVDGWEVFRQIRAKESLKDVPVVVITAKAQMIDRVLGLQIAGVDDYITKPFGPSELIHSVEQLLGPATEPGTMPEVGSETGPATGSDTGPEAGSETETETD